MTTSKAWLNSEKGRAARDRENAKRRQKTAEKALQAQAARINSQPLAQVMSTWGGTSCIGDGRNLSGLFLL